MSFKTCTWFSTYRIHHRSASRFRDRRCFLLGDAAHIHSPVGAQGMNTGLQDALQLGMEARARCQTSGRSGAAGFVRGRARPSRATVAEHDRPGVQIGRIRQPDCRAAPHKGARQNRGVCDEVANASSGSRFESSPRSAYITGRAPCRKLLRVCPTVRRKQGIVFHGCGSDCGRTAPSRICSRSLTTPNLT